MKLALASILLALGALVPTAAHAEALIPVDVIGQVQLIPGVACVRCRVSVPGTPVVAETNDQGIYTLRNMPTGATWTIVAVPVGVPGEARLELRVPRVGEAPSFTRSDALVVPPLVIAKPGAVTGRVHLSTTDDVDSIVVGIPSLGIYAQGNIGGVYLLNGVPPGNHTVYAYNGIQRVRIISVLVKSGELTVRNDFPISNGTTPIGR
jgi:hypothetical protein